MLEEFEYFKVTSGALRAARGVGLEEGSELAGELCLGAPRRVAWRRVRKRRKGAALKWGAEGAVRGGIEAGIVGLCE